MRRLAPIVIGIGAVLALLMTGSPVHPAAAEPQEDRAESQRRGSLQIATWNFCNHTCRDYEGRLDALVRTISATRPDVLALQEVSTGTPLTLVEERLSAIGYRNASGLTDAVCTGKCESHVFVRESSMRVLGASATPPKTSERCLQLMDADSFRQLMADLRSSGDRRELRGLMQQLYEERDACLEGHSEPVADPHRGSVSPRQLARRAYGNSIGYAVVAPRAGGRPMLVGSLHFEKQHGTSGFGADDRARNATASGLARWARSHCADLGLPGIPIVLAGDYNSYLRKHPRGPQAVLQRMGYTNADAARTRVGSHYATVNKYPLDAEWDGFPPRPRNFALGGPQIDTIMSKGLGRADRHEIHVRTTADGRFDERFRASDHNLVRAWFRAP